MLSFLQYILRETPEPYPTKDQHWAGTKITKEKDVENLYHQIIKLVKDNYNALSTLLRAAIRGKPAKIMIDIKTLKSFVSKVWARKKNPDQVADILRSAILCKDDADVDFVVNYLRKNTRIVEYEFKKFGGDKQFGYFGAHHLNYYIKSKDANRGLIVETIVATRKLWTYKTNAHAIYDAWRDMDVNALDSVQKEFFEKEKRRSQSLMMRGNL